MPRPTARPAVVAGMAVSVGVHAVVLGFGRLEVPRAPPATVRLVRPAPLRAPEPAPEPAPRVVVIRPPGRLPSGGSSGTRGGDGTTVSGASGPAEEAPPSAIARSPRTSPASVALALSTPVTPGGAPILPAFADSGARRPAPRPGRGIVLRSGGSAVGAGGAGRGTGGSAGPGGLASGGGVAAGGPGGDCITPGIAGRAIPPQGVPSLPRRAPDRPGGRAGAPRRGGRGG